MSIQEHYKFYIDGGWVDPAEGVKPLDVINPATEEPVARIALGSAADVDIAVEAAGRAFESFSRTSKAERLELLQAILGKYQERLEDVAQTISSEMGAPITLARTAQARSGMAHIATVIEILKGYEFETHKGGHMLRREPVGVCGLITPWNWPINQISCKVAPALAAGCTMVLKPSEEAPLNALLFAEILHEAGVPKGVFNLVNGDGPVVGEAMSAHPGIDMMSFTGSTRAGISVARAAAGTVKRVAQELGGKSANIILEDADIGTAVTGGAKHCFNNSGQSCNAPTRMLVPQGSHDEAVRVAQEVAESVTVGDPTSEETVMGPVVNARQFEKIQGLIETGQKEGATLVTGGVGRPQGLNKGYYVRPTVFSNVNNDMTVAREEIFGPVLCILPYENEEEAIAIANDTDYGLAGYVSGSAEHAQEVAGRIRAGQVNVNSANPDFTAPFGGYKQSGNGREWGDFGFEEFLEVKAIIGAKSA